MKTTNHLLTASVLLGLTVVFSAAACAPAPVSTKSSNLDGAGDDDDDDDDKPKKKPTTKRTPAESDDEDVDTTTPPGNTTPPPAASGYTGCMATCTQNSAALAPIIALVPPCDAKCMTNESSAECQACDQDIFTKLQAACGSTQCQQFVSCDSQCASQLGQGNQQGGF